MTTTTETFRAAIWTSDDRQAEVRLTTEGQSSLPDSDLLAAARAEAARTGLDLSTGTIEIGDWTEGGRIPARIDLSNGRRPVLVSDLTDDEISIRWDAIVGMMDDEIREAVHGDIAPCTDRAFLVEYARRHETQFGSLLTLG